MTFLKDCQYNINEDREKKRGQNASLSNPRGDRDWVREEITPNNASRSNTKPVGENIHHNRVNTIFLEKTQNAP